MILQPCRPFEIPTTAVNVLAVGAAGVLYGWGWQETTAVARANIELRDGRTGPLIVPISLSPGQSTRDSLEPFGMTIESGVYLRVVSGSVYGSVWFRPGNPDGTPTRFDLQAAHDELVELGLRGLS